MEERKRRIPLIGFVGDELRKTDLTGYVYRLIGLVEYRPMAGQGDVEHRWIYLCENAQGEPVLITEYYDISVWAPHGPGADQIDRQNLFLLEEEPLTQPEYRHYRSLAKPAGAQTVCLPIALFLRKQRGAGK